MRWLILSLLVGLSNATCVPECDIGEICKNMWGRMKPGAAFLHPVGTLMNPKRVADDVFVIGELAGSWFKMVTFNKDLVLLQSKYISSSTATSLDTLTVSEYGSAGTQGGGGTCGTNQYCGGDFICDSQSPGCTSIYNSYFSYHSGCTEGNICTKVAATIKDNAHNNIEKGQNPMALNTGLPSYIFGGVQGGWFKMVRTNLLGVMLETRYLETSTISDIADLDLNKWDSVPTNRRITDMSGSIVCEENRYCISDFRVSECTEYAEIGVGFHSDYRTVTGASANIDLDMILFENVANIDTCALICSQQAPQMNYPIVGFLWDHTINNCYCTYRKKEDSSQIYSTQQQTDRYITYEYTCPVTCSGYSGYHDVVSYAPHDTPGGYCWSDMLSHKASASVDECFAFCKTDPSEDAPAVSFLHGKSGTATANMCYCWASGPHKEGLHKEGGTYSSGCLDWHSSSSWNSYIIDRSYNPICPFLGEDLSTGQPARADSIYEAASPASKAVDGDISRIHPSEWHSGAHSSCSNFRRYAWWGVELKRPAKNFEVKIYARNDHNENGSEDIIVLVSNEFPSDGGNFPTSHPTEWCGTINGLRDSDTRSVNCKMDKGYKYVILRPRHCRTDSSGNILDVNHVFQLPEVVVTSCSSSSCEQGKYYDEGSTSCIPCATGKYSNELGQSACKDCATGKYNDASGSSTESACKECATGKYSNELGQSACKDCASGKYNDASGSSTESACKDCATGKYNDASGSSTESACKDCEIGKYNNEAGKSSCKSCATGKYNNEAGKSSCKSCATGKYSNELGLSACHDCSQGTSMCNTGVCGTGLLQYPCSLGVENKGMLYEVHFTWDETKIASGSWDYTPGIDGTEITLNGDKIVPGEPALGASSSNELVYDWKYVDKSFMYDGVKYWWGVSFFVANVPQKTAYGFTLKCKQTGKLIAQSNPVTNSGYQSLNVPDDPDDVIKSYNQIDLLQNCEDYMNLLGTCNAGDVYISSSETCVEACSPGTYFTSGYTSCDQCLTGQYQDKSGQSSCKQCVPGTFQDLTQKSSCKQCPTGKYQNEYGKTSCIVCDPGKYQNEISQISCKQCAPGEYQDQQTQSSCDMCVAGQYQNEYGGTSCKDCENQFQDQEGQTSCKDCAAGVPIDGNIRCGCIDGSGVNGPSCSVCEKGTYSSNYICENCPEPKYQDETSQTECKSCPTGWQYHNSSVCLNCPVTDDSHPNYNEWGSGCPPWSSNDGCECDCGDSGFTGEHCDVCGPGMGWNNESGQDARCLNCSYPLINNQTTHDAACSHAYCPPGSGTTMDVNAWRSDKSSDNCVPCIDDTVSPSFYGQCAEVQCEGLTVPKFYIDHTMDITDQSNCELCPPNKVKYGKQCVQPVCETGFPKLVVDQSLSYDDQQNCEQCENVQIGAACYGTCPAGSGAVLKDIEIPPWSHIKFYDESYVGVESFNTLKVSLPERPLATGVICAPNGGTVVDGNCVCEEWAEGPYCQWFTFLECTKHWKDTSSSPYSSYFYHEIDESNPHFSKFVQLDNSNGVLKCSIMPLCNSVTMEDMLNPGIKNPPEITPDTACRCGEDNWADWNAGIRTPAPPIISNGFCIDNEHVTSDSILFDLELTLLDGYTNVNITTVQWFQGKVAVVVSGNNGIERAFVQLYDVSLGLYLVNSFECGLDVTGLSADGDKLYVGYTDKIEVYDTDLHIEQTHTMVGGSVSAKNGVIVGTDMSKVQILSENSDVLNQAASLLRVRGDGEFIALLDGTKVSVYKSSDGTLSTFEVEAKGFDWFGEHLIVAEMGKVGVYDVSLNNIAEYSVSASDISTFIFGYPPQYGVFFEGAGKMLKSLCSNCSHTITEDGERIQFTNTGSDPFCKQVQCDVGTMVKLNDVDPTLSHTNQDNCANGCVGYHAGPECKDIECNIGSHVRPYEGEGPLVDHLLNHTNQDNCVECSDTQVADNEGNVRGCLDIQCPENYRINRINKTLAPDDIANCAPCTGLTVVDGTECKDIDCGTTRRIKPEYYHTYNGGVIFSTILNINRSLAYNDIGNCGDECSGAYILDQNDKTKCVECTDSKVPSNDRSECEVFTCPNGYTKKETIDNSLAFDDLGNCDDIDECAENPCDGECTNTDGEYVCTDPIAIGDSIETFVDRNRHICPHGFVLTANKPTAMNRISSPSGDFACPKLKSLGENVVYNDNHIMTQFITHINEGALESEYCTYAYRKITKDIENFRDEV